MKLRREKKHLSIAMLIESVNRDRGASSDGRRIFNFLNNSTNKF